MATTSSSDGHVVGVVWRSGETTPVYDGSATPTGAGVIGGVDLVTQAELTTALGTYVPLLSGAGSPEGATTGTVGQIYEDTTNGALYVKKTGSGNTGWSLLSQVGGTDVAVADGGTGASTADAARENLALNASEFELNGFNKAFSNTNFAAFPAANICFARGARVTSTSAQNNEVVFLLPQVLQAGTWTLALVYRQLTTAGIMTIAVSPDNVTYTDITTLDQYAASPVSDNRSEMTGLTIAAGMRYLRCKMATKNASSSAYDGCIGILSGVRTGP